MKKILILISLLIAAFAGIQCASDGSNDSGTGQQEGKGGSLATFALKNDYLYTVDNQSLNVFWIQNTVNPVHVGKVTIGFNIETIYSLDDYLFIGSQNGMHIYDITAPENPKRLSAVQHFTACDPVVANATHAFVTLHSNTLCGSNINVLEVYDISDVKNPVLIHQRGLTQPRGLALQENYLIICDDELKIFDITNAAEPTIVKALPYTYKDVLIYNNSLFAFGENRITQFKWTNGDFLSLAPISSLIY